MLCEAVIAEKKNAMKRNLLEELGLFLSNWKFVRGARSVSVMEGWYMYESCVLC